MLNVFFFISKKERREREGERKRGKREKERREKEGRGIESFWGLLFLEESIIFVVDVIEIKGRSDKNVCGGSIQSKNKEKRIIK